MQAILTATHLPNTSLQYEYLNESIPSCLNHNKLFPIIEYLKSIISPTQPCHGSSPGATRYFKPATCAQRPPSETYFPFKVKSSIINS